MRQTCRHFRENDLDLFQYSRLLPSHTVGGHYQYQKDRKAVRRILSNLATPERFRAALSNKTFPSNSMPQAIFVSIVKNAKSDDATTISLLLNNEVVRKAFEKSCEASNNPCQVLDVALKKEFHAIAAELQKNKVIQAKLVMCRSCSTNVGCYECSMSYYCAQYDQDSNSDHDDDSLPKYCRSCVKKDAINSCKICQEYTCPKCIKSSESNKKCSICRAVVCIPRDEAIRCSMQCNSCQRVFCAKCNATEKYMQEYDECCDGCCLKDDPWSGEEDY